MHCPSCAATVRGALSALPGVTSVRADLQTKVVTVAVRDGVGRADLCGAITATGHVCGEE